MSETSRRALVVRIVWVLVAVAAFAGVVSLTLVSRARAALEESEAALGRGDVALAIVMAKRAAQAKLPGSDVQDRAYERLFAIARAREEANDRDGAASAYRAVISAARSTDDATSPHADRARAALEKLGDGKAVATEIGLPSPPPWARFALAGGVVLLAIGLTSVARGARIGWAIFAAGLVGIGLAALS